MLRHAGSAPLGHWRDALAIPVVSRLTTPTRLALYSLHDMQRRKAFAGLMREAHNGDEQ
jgi:hypothetical protein